MKFLRSALLATVLPLTVPIALLVSSPANASTSYCGHGTDGVIYYHSFQYHFYGAGPYMHYVAGWSPFSDGYIDHYDGVYCTS